MKWGVGPSLLVSLGMQPSTLHGLLDNVEEFINEKETLKAMARLRLPQKIA
jgi:hypothetical protein